MRFHSLSRLLVALAVCLMTVGCSNVGYETRGLESTDPQLVGKRDPNYDHVISYNSILPSRAGPVVLGYPVADAVQHLGNPDEITSVNYPNNITPRDNYFYYKNECIGFHWSDQGLSPVVRQIVVDCGKWSSRNGIRVGLSIKDTLAIINGPYCADEDKGTGSFIIYTQVGLIFFAKNRNSPIYEIAVDESWVEMKDLHGVHELWTSAGCSY